MDQNLRIPPSPGPSGKRGYTAVVEKEEEGRGWRARVTTEKK